VVDSTWQRARPMQNSHKVRVHGAKRGRSASATCWAVQGSAALGYAEAVLRSAVGASTTKVGAVGDGMPSG
jgi:hypothetical protein